VRRADAFLTLLERMRGERIRAELWDGTSVEGRLLGFDERANIVLDEAEEFFNGLLRTRHERLIIRGSSIVSIRRADLGRQPLADS